MSQKRYIDIFVSLGQCFFLLHVNILLILFNFFLSVSRSDSVFTLISHNHTESSHSHGVKCVCSGGGGGVVSVGGVWGVGEGGGGVSAGCFSRPTANLSCWKGFY